MSNGICRGGPWDGKQYLSDKDYINADYTPPKPVYAMAGKARNIKIKTHTYKKQWLGNNGTRWYQWV